MTEYDARNNCFHSFLKNHNTATKVPKCSAASNVKPYVSCETPNSLSNKIKCPVEETGKNSVIPCTAPSNMALKSSIIAIVSLRERNEVTDEAISFMGLLLRQPADSNDNQLK